MKAILNVFVTADRMSHSTNAVLKPYGISKEQFNVLRILKGQKGTPIALNIISDRMVSKSSNATRLVEKLRQKGLVERNQCPTDRRQVDILITPAGEELLDVVNPIVRAVGEENRNLSAQEAKQLNDLLDKMRG